ncbi:ABC transporter ATP-binding protein [Desulfovibrio sp. X2]|uniref:ABC transporter ATP-binding protein n=1 Tax=Desulfovibrio sp. X2 TaxID=941449 RepID=UPI00055911B0|nr:ABC transporter ATP-binding protein [Desulfovibrio sp. X2]
MQEPLVVVEGVSKSYRRGDVSETVLEDITFSIGRGEFLSLMGPSGSGKSTLLNLIAGLDKPDAGSIIVDGLEVSDLTEAELARWRSQSVGFVFQFYNLIPVLTALENVELPLLLTGLSRAERREHAAAALSLVSLSDRLGHYPKQLSGGQQQRVSIARALVSDPLLLVADEPTGDLDRKSAEDVLDLMERMNRDFGKTIVMVTHDPHAAARAGTMLYLDKGSLGSAPQDPL